MELKSIVQQFINTEDENITIKQINNGLINSTFWVNDTKNNQQFILQKINTKVFQQPENIVKNHFTINEILAKSGYTKTIVKPIKTLKGNLLDECENQWRMQEFIPNCKTFMKVPDKETAYESAKLLSEFYYCINQEKSENIEETLPGFIDFEKRINDYKLALENAKSELAQNAEQEIKYINQQIELPKKWIKLATENQLPKRLIHADPKISNILFSEAGKAIAIIDLDTVMQSTILYDFGDMVRSYTNKTDEDDGKITENFDSEIYAEIKAGFLKHLEKMLTPLEIELTDYAATVVIYIQAVRFLTDYLCGSTYYSTNYAEHNLDRTKNQINLLKGLQQFLSK